MSEFGSIKTPPEQEKDPNKQNREAAFNDSFNAFGMNKEGTTNEAPNFKNGAQVSKQADPAKNQGAATKAENENGAAFQQVSNGLLPTAAANNANNAKKPGGKSRCIGHYMIGKNIGEGTFGKVVKVKELNT